MEKTRLVELSLYYTIQKTLAVRKTNELPTTSDYKNYTLKYKDISTFFEPIVEVNGTVSSNYSVNYRDGIIVFDTTLSQVDIVKVTYEYNKVNIYDEGMNPTEENFKYPAIALYEVDMEDEAYELGNNIKEKHGIWGIDVLTERGGERHDIADKLQRVLSEESNIPIVDFNIAFPINADGTKNESYNEESQTIGYIICNSINKRNGGSLGIGDRPKYLSEIAVRLSYV